MKSVEMTRDLRPFHKGQRAIVDDETAARLIASGEGKDPEPFPAGAASTPPVAPAREPGRVRTYLTKGR